MSRNTRGCDAHSGIAGFGQNTGRSFGVDRYDRRLRGVASHRHTFVSQCFFDAFLPFTVSKNSSCSFVGDRPARARCRSARWSYSRIGVTSAAVPVKNASSAM